MTNVTETREFESAKQPERLPGGYVRADDPRKKGPGLAGFLSLVPGLGQIYVGYYARGFVHAVIVGSLLALLVASDERAGTDAWFPLGIVFLIFFMLYNIIDAFRRATLYNLSLEGLEQIELPDDFSNLGLGGSYAGGGALVIFGVIALSHTAFGISLAWLEDWWPLAPLLFGAYLIYKAYLDSQGNAD